MPTPAGRSATLRGLPHPPEGPFSLRERLIEEVTHGQAQRSHQVLASGLTPEAVQQDEPTPVTRLPRHMQRPGLLVMGRAPQHELVGAHLTHRQPQTLRSTDNPVKGRPRPRGHPRGLSGLSHVSPPRWDDTPKRAGCRCCISIRYPRQQKEHEHLSVGVATPPGRQAQGVAFFVFWGLTSGSLPSCGDLQVELCRTVARALQVAGQVQVVHLGQ